MKRVVIVDVAHIIYKYAFGSAGQLSTTLMVDGVPRVVSTTIPNYVIKTIHRWSNFGCNPTVVCFNSNYGPRCRRAYFLDYPKYVDGVKPIEYTGSKVVQDTKLKESMNLTMNLLLKGGVTCLKADNYEAKDLIKAAVDKAKVDYPDLPIDVVTSDVTLLPLVDNRVSVFLQSKKYTYAESSEIEKRNYIQVTPSNYQHYVEDMTNFNKIRVPYNSLLFSMLLRGYKNLGIPAYPKMTPKKYNSLVESLTNDLGNLSSLIYYAPQKVTAFHKGTESYLTVESAKKHPAELIKYTYHEPEPLQNLCSVLRNYVDDNTINHVKFIYNGLNLNCGFSNINDVFNRNPACITSEIKIYNQIDLQQAVNLIDIELPIDTDVYKDRDN